MSELMALVPPADFQQLVERASQHGLLLAFLTEKFLSAEAPNREMLVELREAVKEAGPDFRRVMAWWRITTPPTDPPVAGSYAHWSYRRAVTALAHAAVACEAGAGGKQAVEFARCHIPPVDVDWLQVRLLAETQAARPARKSVAVHDPYGDYELAAREHWCDAVEERAGREFQVQPSTEADPAGAVTIPSTSPLSASDLAKLLRTNGCPNVTDGAVSAFLGRYRERYQDCYVPVDPDDRRCRMPKYLYRPEVWPLLFQHFSRRNTADSEVVR